MEETIYFSKATIGYIQFTLKLNEQPKGDEGVKHCRPYCFSRYFIQITMCLTRVIIIMLILYFRLFVYS